MEPQEPPLDPPLEMVSHAQVVLYVKPLNDHNMSQNEVRLMLIAQTLREAMNALATVGTQEMGFHTQVCKACGPAKPCEHSVPVVRITDSNPSPNCTLTILENPALRNI